MEIPVAWSRRTLPKVKYEFLIKNCSFFKRGFSEKKDLNFGLFDKKAFFKE